MVRTAFAEGQAKYPLDDRRTKHSGFHRTSQGMPISQLRAMRFQRKIPLISDPRISLFGINWTIWVGGRQQWQLRLRELASTRAAEGFSRAKRQYRLNKYNYNFRPSRDGHSSSNTHLLQAGLRA
jgi:hypothetical protein